MLSELVIAFAAGFVVVWIMTTTSSGSICPACKGTIHLNATRCGHCGIALKTRSMPPPLELTDVDVISEPLPKAELVYPSYPEDRLEAPPPAPPITPPPTAAMREFR